VVLSSVTARMGKGLNLTDSALSIQGVSYAQSLANSSVRQSKTCVQTLPCTRHIHAEEENPTKVGQRPDVNPESHQPHLLCQVFKGSPTCTELQGHKFNGTNVALCALNRNT
jgi:hypothetical protein